VTSGGTGYLDAWAAAGASAAKHPGTIWVTVVVVDSKDSNLRRLEQRALYWILPSVGARESAAQSVGTGTHAIEVVIASRVMIRG
jgi:hypothetical protein